MVDKLRRGIALLLPYFELMRLRSSEITLLATFPTCASIAMVSESPLKAFWLFIFVSFAALVVRSTGCVINDIFDRDIDFHVARTKSRPIASGQLTTMNAVCILIPLLCVIGIVLLFINKLSFYLSMICGVGVVIYPLTKRFFAYPQFVLGIVWNFGILIGSAIAINKIALGPVLLYIGCIFWVTAFDTIYAHQDKEYDAALGVGSTALKFGGNTGKYIKRLYIITITMWFCAGIVAYLGWPYYLCMLACMAVFYYQYKKTDFDNPQRCMYMFKANIYVGVLLFLGACLGRGV
ncbi:MAG: 4-hydroxybenzoate octaprenyltransferase [Aaplasma endosymbiont of Hyalomma asiaticum]